MKKQEHLKNNTPPLLVKALLTLCFLSLLSFKIRTTDNNQASYRGTIYLTFDAAPSEGSLMLNDIVLCENIPVAVFLTGEYVIATKKTIAYFGQYKDNDLIDCCNFGFTDRCYKGRNFYKDPIFTLEDFAYNEYLLRLENKMCRLPDENIWKFSSRSKAIRKSLQFTTELLSAFQYELYGWDIEWQYNTKRRSMNQSKGEFIQELQKLLHTKKTFTPGHIVVRCNEKMLAQPNLKAEFVDAIQQLKSEGFSFAYLSTYPSYVLPGKPVIGWPQVKN